MAHPSLAAVEGYEVRGNAALWIVCEYVPGTTLDSWMASGRRLPLPAVINLVRDVCLGVFAAQRQGLTHHALHPGNVVVSDENRLKGTWLDAKLIDLSIASWMQPEWPSLSNAHFIAPETLATMLVGGDPSGQIDARANVYSCGALLYHLATGSLPFLSPGLHELAAAQAVGKLWAPQGHNSEISVSLQTVILGALAIRPSGRYANTGELASALAAVAWRDGFADAYEPSVVAPLPLLQQRELRISDVAPKPIDDDVTDTSGRVERTARTRNSAWSSIRNAF